MTMTRKTKSEVSKASKTTVVLSQSPTQRAKYGKFLPPAEARAMAVMLAKPLRANHKSRAGVLIEKIQGRRAVGRTVR